VRRGLFTHFRSAGVCELQPWHTDMVEPWRRSADVTTPSCVFTSQRTVFCVIPRSHGLWRRQAHFRVPRSTLNAAEHLVLEPGDVYIGRRDMVHAGAKTTTQNDRLLLFLNRGEEDPTNKFGKIVWE